MKVGRCRDVKEIKGGRRWRCKVAKRGKRKGGAKKKEGIRGRVSKGEKNNQEERKFTAGWGAAMG